MGVTPRYRTKHCACGCGRVGRFHTYATRACRQRAYRNRKKGYNDTKAQTVSQWLIEQFGDDDCAGIFEPLNRVKGQENIKAVNQALEQIVYLVEAKVRREKSRARRISK